MSTPETIAVKFSEDLAQYADIRPVRTQPMTLSELVGLVLTHTGKDRDRVRELLRRGTCTYNIYKYWWEPLDPDYTELEVALDAYPDPDPSLAFDPSSCQLARFSDLAEPRPRIVEILPEDAGRRRWFAAESLWPFLLRFAASRRAEYVDYSYKDKADRFALDLRGAVREELAEGIGRLATRRVRRRLDREPNFARLELLCQRPS